MTTQSRPGTTNLVALVIASVVGLSVVGCSHPTTPTGSSLPSGDGVGIRTVGNKPTPLRA